MNNVLLQPAIKLNNDRKHRKWWQRAVRVMAMIVVFCTTYALILPAITMESEAVCGIDAHVHGEGCYTTQPVYSYLCAEDDGTIKLHSHDEFCYDGEGGLICPLPELPEHSHSDACSGEVKILICENIHVHDTECEKTEAVLVCGREESEPHVHGESCITEETVLTCQQQEHTAHTHDDNCITEEQVLSCTVAEDDTHSHTDGCYTLQQLPCPLEETEGHAHGEGCYAVQQTACSLEETEGHIHNEGCCEQRLIPCELTTNDGHVHEESCYELQSRLVCGLIELVPHVHEADCYDADGNVICTLPQTTAHDHTQDCRVESGTVEVLICRLEEHIHEELCFPVEENGPQQLVYLCGTGVHTHVDSCHGADGQLACSIPEHTHEAACLVAELDLTADVETAQQWEQTLTPAELTGNWSRDVLVIAETQLDYSESVKNVVLENDRLMGYTRYGQWFGLPYGDWCAMYASFVLHYAHVEGYPLESSVTRWIDALTEAGLYLTSDTYTAKAGDLVFFDYEQRQAAQEGAPEIPVEADHVGIVVKMLPATEATPAKLVTIEGNVEGRVTYVSYDMDDPAIIGYGMLPENPMSAEQLAQAAEVAAQIKALPSAQTVQTQLQLLNHILDKVGYDAYLAQITAQLDTARQGYAALAEEQKYLANDKGVLQQLDEVLAGAVWQQLPALTQDGAAITALSALEPEHDTVGLNQTAFFGFYAETGSYTEEKYGEARVKLEFVLPLSREQAVFDTSAMSWLEDPVETLATRTVGESEIECQVLTGYKHLAGATVEESVVPGSFTASAAVKVLAMKQEDPIWISVSAAMEHGVWDGVCQTHQSEEKLTVRTGAVTVVNQVSEEEQQAQYSELQAEYEQLLTLEMSEKELAEQAEALWNRVSGAYLAGRLTEESFNELSPKIYGLIYSNYEALGEAVTGTNWMLLQESGWFEKYSDAEQLYAENRAYTAMRTGTARRALMLTNARAAQTSQQQILNEGGGEVSSEGAVYVSKTIAGTDTENVFDITLQIITQDIVTEVYKEPDMAVVIVLDISNTMRENFGTGATRYSAAVAAAESFIDQFAANNLGASNLGFVAFNTDAHEILPMSTCSSAAQAAALKNTVRTKTGAIINASGYASSHSRFTNIEAGLKRAYDLLNTVENENQYIIFLSDGFPTTYVSSGYSGYDPYDSSGTRFYDSVELYNGKVRPCSAGTSYSDEAAIRARKMAVSLKEAGATIFSIGVDIGGQTIKKYVDSFAGDSFTVVDRRNTNYEIGSDSDPAAFKNWLQNSIGSGDGCYYDSTNASGLNSAFESIFTRIKELNAESSHLDWVATDPMPGMGETMVDTVEFIGFYDKNDTLVDGDLTGSSGDGWNYENTASFDTDSATILWDLKQSRYISTVAGNATNYTCSLTYRVRLKNENADFVEYDSYNTNDVTKLTYRIIDKTGSKITVSEQREVQFPIPAVEGYLATLSFTKVGSLGSGLPGATFTLTHDTAACGNCRGDGKANSHVALSVMEQTSGANGQVIFENIPSGHTYILEETVVPSGHQSTGSTYQVTVAYDTLTVTVKDKDGNDVAWNEIIVNITEYVLPNTGGTGYTLLYMLGGTLLLAAAMIYVVNFGRKRQKGGA